LERSNTEGQKTISRLIIRDDTGKHSWEVANLFKLFELNEILERSKHNSFYFGYVFKYKFFF